MTVAVLVLSFTILFLLARIPAVQTFIVSKVSEYISKETKSTVSIESVKFSFFNKIELDSVLIRDQYNDTLLFTPEITAGIRQIRPRENKIKLGKVVIIKPVIGLITDSTGVMNLNRYLDKLSSPGDSASGKRSSFQINQIEISDGRFSLINRSVTKGTTSIDFNNLRLTSINAIVENLEILDDSVTLDIYNLGFKEANGFVVKKLSSNLNIHNQNIIFSDVNIMCDSSIIDADRIAILPRSGSSFGKFTDEVKLDIVLKKSLVNSNDLKYFINSLNDYNESVWISGNVSGTLSELKGKNISLTYKDETYLNCNFDFSGLPEIDNTFMYIDVIDFRSISKDIEQIKLPGKEKIVLPEALRKLGVVSFAGSFTGFTTDFVTYGRINTNKGIISTDISLRPSGSGIYRVKGVIRGSDIDLGSITGNPEIFGSLSMEANIDGTARSFETFAVNLSGKIDSVGINMASSMTKPGMELLKLKMKTLI
jgi:hypothetical protein